MASKNPDNSGSRSFFRGSSQKRRNRGRPPHNNSNFRQSDSNYLPAATNWEQPHSVGYAAEFGASRLSREESNAFSLASQPVAERVLANEYASSSTSNSHSSRSHDHRQANPNYLNNLSYISSRECPPNQSQGQYHPHASNINQNYGENPGQAYPVSASRGSRRPSGKNRFQRGHSSNHQQYQRSRTVDVESLRSDFTDNLHLANGDRSHDTNQPTSSSRKSRGASSIGRRGNCF